MEKFFIELFEKADNEECAREVKGDGEIGYIVVKIIFSEKMKEKENTFYLRWI